MEKYGIDAMIALHVACAEKSGSILVTTDDALIKKSKGGRPISLYVRVTRSIWFLR